MYVKANVWQGRPGMQAFHYTAGCISECCSTQGIWLCFSKQTMRNVNATLYLGHIARQTSYIYMYTVSVYSG